MQPIVKVFKSAIANDTYNHSIGRVNEEVQKILANDIALHGHKVKNMNKGLLNIASYMSIHLHTTHYI